ncbi:MAG TPA: hypothetical protein VMI32_17015 [Candidatus Solibacter sp.]|nr:hypothetical protein [Candidatus Solibacter sp.]
MNEVKGVMEWRGIVAPTFFVNVAFKGVAAAFPVNVADEGFKVAGFSVSCAASVTGADKRVAGEVFVSVAAKGVIWTE